MKRSHLYPLITLSLLISPISLNAETNILDANRLLDFAENAEPALLFPPTDTQQANGEGSDWFFRFYSGSDSYVAININGTGPFFEGSVYVLGPQFGGDLLYVDTLENLIATIDAIEPLPSGVENAITNPGNGNCVARIFSLKNDTARYRTTTFSGDTSIISERSEFYEEFSDTETITVIEQSSSVDGAEITTSNRQTTFFQSLNGMFFESEIDSVITNSLPGTMSSNQNVNTTYAPSLFIGPADLLCEGQEWVAASVTQTTINDPELSGDGPLISQTLPLSGIIDAVGENVAVAGGDYSTIKMTLTYPDSRTIIWTDIDFGVKVLSETYQGNSENPSSIDELLQFELPF